MLIKIFSPPLYWLSVQCGPHSSHLAEHRPVLLGVAAHDAGNDDVVGEVPLELVHSLTPVGGCLLTDELDVEEGSLPWAIRVAGGGPSNDAGGHVSDDVLQSGSHYNALAKDTLLPHSA